MTAYLIAMAVQAGLYALLALSLNLQWGYSGLLNFGVAGFVAVGAYAYAIAYTVGDLGVVPSILIAIVVGGIVAYPMGLASIRVRVGFYLAIVTLGFSEVVRSVIVNESWLTNGTRGMAVPRFFPGLSNEGNQLALLGIILAAVLVVYLVFQRIGRSPFGRTLEAIRDNEDAARSLGKPVAGFKIQVFIIGSAVAAGAGALTAVNVGFLVPDQFLPILTFNVWMAMIIGGSGSNKGVLLGSVLLVLFVEGSRFLKDILPEGVEISDAKLAALRLMIVGAALIIVPTYWPRGILGRKEH